MKRFLLALPLIFAVVFLGCATSATDVKTAGPVDTPVPTPPPAAGQAAVFGRISLTERVYRVSMPTPDQSGRIYMNLVGTDKVYSIGCSDAGEFGVFLPPGDYRVVKIRTQGYKFVPDLLLSVPADTEAVYAGTIVLDGTPAGAVAGTADLSMFASAIRALAGTVDTKFAYTVKDDQREYVAAIKRAAPGTEVRLKKALFTPRGGVAYGRYPSKVLRAKDLQENLSARTDAVEEVFSGAVVALPYIINPVWLFTLPLN